MEMSPDIMERMDSYLEGRMSPDEQGRFEQALENSPELSQLFEEHQSLIFAVEASSVQKTIQDVVIRNRKSTTEVTRTRPLYNKAIGIAAAIVILLGLFFIIDPGTNPSQQLFAEHYQSDPGLPTLMSSANDVAFQNAMTAYKQGNYGDALDRFNNLATTSTNDTLRFYASMCHLELSQPEESIALLNSIESSSSFYEKASWYLALSYLQDENILEAKKLIEQITRIEKHLFLDDAKELLSQLDQE